MIEINHSKSKINMIKKTYRITKNIIIFQIEHKEIHIAKKKQTRNFLDMRRILYF